MNTGKWLRKKLLPWKEWVHGSGCNEDDMNVINGTWAFKCKKISNGILWGTCELTFVLVGNNKGIDFFETYAPVVQWTTVCLMLILENLIGLKSKQADVTADIHTADFHYANLGEDEKVSMEILLSFNSIRKFKVLCLKNTLYVLHQNLCAFLKYFTENLVTGPISSSIFDPCIVIGDKVICYVDDIIYWVRNEKNIVKLAAHLHDK
ncbi:LOW QUALITY PROTEIN: hypothetical protein ACHAXS_000199 [Conticribra weissflogii]